MADARHEQTLAHLRLLAGLPGYWELRGLRRDTANHMTPRGSFWIVATATANGLLYERRDQALAWADGHARQGAELFVGVNARSMEGKTKTAVPVVTACFADLDLGGDSIDEALAELPSGQTPAPSFIVHSGYGLGALPRRAGPGVRGEGGLWTGLLYLVRHAVRAYGGALSRSHGGGPGRSAARSTPHSGRGGRPRHPDHRCGRHCGSLLCQLCALRSRLHLGARKVVQNAACHTRQVRPALSVAYGVLAEASTHPLQ